MENLSRRRYFCPYNGCKSATSSKSHLYRHIRRQHDKKFPKLKAIQYNFTTPSGKMIKFDEKGCVDTLNAGERIKVARVANSELLAYCPYQGCKYTCFWGNIYAHIRKKHHPDFPRLDDLIRYQIKTKDGDKVLDLRCETVRDSVAVGEPLCAIPFEYNKR